MRTLLIFIKPCVCFVFLLFDNSLVWKLSEFRTMDQMEFMVVILDLLLQKKSILHQKNGDNIYKDYFGNLADNYTSLEDPEGETFTDTDNYASNQNNDHISTNFKPLGVIKLQELKFII